MAALLKMTAFCLLAIGFFALFSNFGIPQIVPAPPPEELELDLGSMSMDEFVAVGERTFTGKGACTLCHNELGRAPVLSDAIANTQVRLADPRYQGTAQSAEEYLRESMIEPSKYVVEGFGVVGTNDQQSPMPGVTGAGVGLSEAEITAVIAYLQDLSGAPITVAIPAAASSSELELEPEAELEVEVGAASPRPKYASAEEIVSALGCGACHKIAGQQGAIGPDLTNIGASRDVDYLRRSILDPNADVSGNYPPNMMPPVYGDQLYASELEMLIGYMAELK